ncbi:alpha-hydroxy acid oxidase [Tuwongella immobilis]|uniref:FMN hydroxy acid dehydrogenase domain-containing protein n=1 Tax=Tuwongella immobilis TaxID=692036 RepID=A0A6C2YNK8_9BACT|nr:alpha-hydroxy acid oxidase [Tuwongella immobilis]VIP03210.1 2-hydroxy-acid oxidase : FMN-dependent alpha-hydroxy acid dehydrogenase OS=Trichodesmium erythraeum (strain IMS101) GN=Tery_2398 PE=4 SV=1: FMN_dh [Tuwongella immobilis]VTS03718.1 2-hydroxy-acid oxidase : FMN-dependent alpha-hydroxy acid dehydrogenase OS=Trichodesmium erythraeum (strain IMS101) GN=Tery_2398 PE=4 SV=1: FMN_dh [Tuwongella immobilis]
MRVCVNLADYEQAAKLRMTKSAFGYYAAGAGDELTLRANVEAFQRLRLRPRMLVDVTQRDPSTTLLGHRVPMPVTVAPMGFHRLAHPEGELATVRAVTGQGLIFVASTMATSTLEAIAAAATGRLWFQLYCFRDREITRSLIRRAEAAGYSAFQLTVDVPVLGRREADIRNNFQLPEDCRVANLEPYGLGSIRGGSDRESSAQEYTDRLFDASLTWETVDWIRSQTRLPVMLKGILRGDDAARGIDHGATGIVVSNHGGRQLDSGVSTFEVLPEIVQAVRGRVPVLIDSGVRRGVDVVKALAVGASAVQLGRPVLWGLAVDGQAGVERVLSLFRMELDNALALCGCPNLAAIGPDLIARRFAEFLS